MWGVTDLGRVMMRITMIRIVMLEKGNDSDEISG